MPRYIHLCAEVDYSLKDILIDADEYRECGANPADYFVDGATNITEVGEVDLEPIAGQHILPDSFGA